jgi:hypothetical protein
MHITQIAYYAMTFAPVGPPGTPLADEKPFQKSGPPERTYPMALVGTAVGSLPPQCAITSTDLTPYAKHWGRNYWPAPAPATVAADGHITTAACNAIGTLVLDLYDAWQQLEFFPVVPVTQIDSVATRALLGVTDVKVDNVFDVQRRRRSKHKTFQYTTP